LSNIEIITRFEHAFRAGDQGTIDELCHPGLVDHTPASDEEPTLAGFKQKVGASRRTSAGQVRAIPAPRG